MNISRLATLCGFAAAMSIAVSDAYAAQAGSFAGFMNKVTGKSGTVGVGSGGVPVITTPTRDLVAGGGWAQAGNFGVGGGAQAADAFVIGGKGTMTLGGKSVEYAGKATISKEAVAGAALGCLTGGIVGCAASAIPLALAWMTTSGARIDPATGALQQKDQNAATPSTGTEYSFEYNNINSGWHSSRQDACNAIAAKWPVTNGPNRGELWTPTNCVVSDNGGSTGTNAAERPSACPAGTYQQPNGSCTTSQGEAWLPASMNDIAPYMAKTEVSPAVVKELVDAGVPVEQLQPGEQADPVKRPAIAISPWTVEGPAEVTGPKVDTVQSDGKKITSQEKTGYTYTGDKITQGPTTTTTTTTTTNPDGTTSTSTDTTTTTKGEDTPDETPTDTPLPDLPKLYERKYPDGMEGIYNEYKDRMKNSQFVELASKLMPSVPAGGQCPSWPINLNLSSWAAYGTHDVAPPCWIWDAAAAVLVVSALLLARALVFGG